MVFSIIWNFLLSFDSQFQIMALRYAKLFYSVVTYRIQSCVHYL